MDPLKAQKLANLLRDFAIIFRAEAKDALHGGCRQISALAKASAYDHAAELIEKEMEIP